MASLGGAIKFALAWEKRARSDYLRWGEEAKQKNARALFMNLVRMEERHIRLLKGVDLKGDVEVKLPGIEWFDSAKDMVSVPSIEDRHLKTIFEYAMGKEEASVQRYSKLASAVTEGELRDLFTLLSKEEHHKDLIRDEYHRIFQPTQ